MSIFPSAAESSRQDANQHLSLTVVQGSAGTATAGTTLTMPVTGDPVTGAMYVNNIGAPSGNPTAGTLNTIGTIGTILGLGGTVTTVGGGTTPVNVISGTQQTLGTIGVLNTGTINALASGTITTGTVSVTIGTITGKDANAVAQTSQPVAVGGTDSGGTVRTAFLDSTGHWRADIPTGTLTTGTLQNLVSGTINALASGTITGGTLQNLVTGTINALASGTITTGTVSVTTGTVINNGGSVSIQGLQANAAAAVGNPFPTGGTDSGGTVRSVLVDSAGVSRSTGSQVMTIGTLTTGTLQNLVTGTINALASGTITAGTLTNLVSGTINALASGTITAGTLTNLVSGTINALASGTITGGTLTNLVSGTINGGTVQTSPIPTFAMPTFGTHGTTGATIFGTLVGGTNSGAGTEIFLTSISLSIPSTAGSQDVSIGWGTGGGTFHSGTGRIIRGNFLAGGGVQKTFDPPINSGTNAQLAYFQAGAGTVDIDITYFTTTSTL